MTSSSPLTVGGDGPIPPRHVAIIMDGNGRWAQARHLPRTAGHKKGTEAVRVAVDTAIEMGISYLTLFGFSSENWKRPASEVADLMGLLRLYLRKEVGSLHSNGVRLRVIGDRSRLATDIVALIEESEALTCANSRLVLTIALSYGGRSDITEATRAIAAAVQAGTLELGDIDENTMERFLSTAGVPDPDLLIRTSGEQRISNFLLWQAAYAEFVFLDVLWPDFDRDTFRDAVAEFQRRERRYGATGV